jgi:peptidoglycan/xylan/chitin deacetylase (PgdA/CDA1 family)
MELIRSTPLAVLRGGARIWRALRGFTSTPGASRCLILMYHDIGDGIPAELFRKQMDYLSRAATVMPFNTLLERARSRTARGISCAITFDDGYEGVYRVAFPCLLEHNFPALVYLSTGLIHESVSVADPSFGLIAGRRLLSWRHVGEMDRHGMGFGSHLSEHGDLSVLARPAAMNQLCRSREELAARLGKPGEHFAYPFGRLSAQSVNWVCEAGYRTAVTTVHRAVAGDDDPLRLPRVGIEDRYSLADFESVVRGDLDFIGLLQDLRRPTLRMRPRLDQCGRRRDHAHRRPQSPHRPTR